MKAMQTPHPQEVSPGVFAAVVKAVGVGVVEATWEIRGHREVHEAVDAPAVQGHRVVLEVVASKYKILAPSACLEHLGHIGHTIK